MIFFLKKLSFLFAAVLILFAQISCNSEVTETGNPCGTVNCDGSVPVRPGSEEPDSPQGDVPAYAAANEYTNSSYGVRVSYPSGWTYVEDADGAGVSFSDNAGQPTSAKMSFTKLSPKPAGLLSYLENQYPDRNFVAYSTTDLLGYFYDDPEVGAHGGGAGEYFFLKGDVLIHIKAEVFSAALSQFEKFLEGISFMGISQNLSFFGASKNCPDARRPQMSNRSVLGCT